MPDFIGVGRLANIRLTNRNSVLKAADSQSLFRSVRLSAGDRAQTRWTPDHIPKGLIICILGLIGGILHHYRDILPTCSSATKVHVAGISH
ncbi:hypothetical protein BDW42DRAFT_181818 [Aspergillus taichungensis]|uniref:Uncharacterized protein n=1 Tax=Aspergillus taichungensis TaxID=482145 RepID=A0A2J5HD71_9EURO|nr:hypothetical protein BDW42DRAFT_181818 [Aspergillus taichungensis]